FPHTNARSRRVEDARERAVASKTRVNALKARKRPRRGAATTPRDNHRERFPRSVAFRLQPARRIQDLLDRRASRFDHWGMQMGARISRSYWLALAGLVATLTIAAASCDPAQARVKSKRDHSRPRAIHGPS